MHDGLIAAFCSTPSRRRLYDTVAQSRTILLETGAGEQWTVATTDGTTTIAVTPSDYPEACLAHELLHAKLEIDGYRHYTYAVSAAPKTTTVAVTLGILDNELQHHKFFQEFLDLGFPPDQMYHDSDKESYERTIEQIAQWAPDSPSEYFLSTYLTIMAPGGNFTNAERGELETALRQKAPAAVWRSLREAKRAIAEYRDSSTLDASATITRILCSLGGHEPTWVGHTTQFPEDGFFIGPPFEF